LNLGVVDAVARVAAEQILILVALGFEHFGHLMIRFDSVVHAVPHDVGVKQIAIADREE
jgi:hypothetical protein